MSNAGKSWLKGLGPISQAFMTALVKRILSFIVLVSFCLASLLPTPLAAASAPVPLAVAASAEDIQEKAVQKGLAYLATLQNPDGGFASDSGRTSSHMTTAWVIMALSAAGEAVEGPRWIKNGHSAVDFLQAGSSALPVIATTDYARILLALSAAQAGVNYKGVNLVEKLLSCQQANGQFAQVELGEAGLVNAHMWSVLALTSAGHQIPQQEKAKDWLQTAQNPDGGFGWMVGELSDPDDTGVAISALVCLGENPTSSPVVQKALTYLRAQQRELGGFEWAGHKSNAATDSWVIQGLLAAGADVTGSEWQINGHSPFSHLLSLQNAEGSFNWTQNLKSTPGLMTAYALMALKQKPIPVNMTYACWTQKTLKMSFEIGRALAWVDGAPKQLEGVPFIVANSSFVPLRFVGEHLGARVEWVAEDSRIDMTYDGRSFSLWVDRASSTTETTAILQAGRTMVPLRYVSEQLGARVTWHEGERRIDIER